MDNGNEINKVCEGCTEDCFDIKSCKKSPYYGNALLEDTHKKDMVEVIRCKDCIYGTPSPYYGFGDEHPDVLICEEYTESSNLVFVTDDDFCSKGEKYE